MGNQTRQSALSAIRIQPRLHIYSSAHPTSLEVKHSVFAHLRYSTNWFLKDRVDAGVDVRVDVRVDVCVDVCVDVRVDVRVDIHVDVRVDGKRGRGLKDFGKMGKVLERGMSLSLLCAAFLRISAILEKVT